MNLRIDEKKSSPLIVGVDFDNTIAGYDALLYRLAFDRGWIPAGMPHSKRIIRDHVRTLPQGEYLWQTLQAEIYGPHMHEAQCIDGVRAFFAACRRHGSTLYIVSHKTQFAATAPDGPDLQAAALNWMEGAGFFSDPAGIAHDHVYFETTRLAKLSRIHSLGCTHFIDDLEETFREEAFPRGTTGLLYSPVEPEEAPHGCLTFGHWDAILGYFERNYWHE